MSGDEVTEEKLRVGANQQAAAEINRERVAGARESRCMSIH